MPSCGSWFMFNIIRYVLQWSMSNSICPMEVHFKKYVSSGGSCPNNICAMVVDQFINMYVH